MWWIKGNSASENKHKALQNSCENQWGQEDWPGREKAEDAEQQNDWERRMSIYANWRGWNALLGRVAAMVKIGTTRVNLTSQWPDAFLSGIFFYSRVQKFCSLFRRVHGDERKIPWWSTLPYLMLYTCIWTWAVAMRNGEWIALQFQNCRDIWAHVHITSSLV
jgi:hypothetical protein